MNADDVGSIAMSSSLGESLTRAAGYARSQGQSEVTLEHMLLALAEDPDARLVLAASNVDSSRLASDVSDYIGRLEEPGTRGSDGEPAVSFDLRRILEAAAAAAKGGRRREINGAIVLAAIVGDGKSPAAQILRSQGLTFEDAILAIQRGAGAPTPIKRAEDSTRTNDTLASSRAQTHIAPGLSTGRGGGGAIGTGQRAETSPQVGSKGGDEPKPAEEAAAVTPEAPPSGAQPDVESEKDEIQTPASPSPASAEETQPPPKTESAGMPSSAPFPPPIPVPGAPPADAAANWTPPSQPSPASERPVQPAAPAGPAPAEQATTSPSPQAAERPGPPPLAPWPEARGPREASPRQPASVDRGSDNSASADTGRRSRISPRAEIGQLVENIPRNMRVATPVLVEVRIARADVKALAEGLQGGGAAYRHEVTITKAMSVRLRAPDGGFFIETASPETQWIEKAALLSSEEFASWRWNVTPREKGKKRLQLVISARTVSGDGLTAETALPDQVITVRVRTNYAKSMSRWAGWVAAALAGGLLARFGEGAYDASLQAFAKFMAS